MSHFSLKTLSFDANDPIPRQYSAEGDNKSPELQWNDPPDGSREFALICDDPDAPTAEPWVHWVLYKIPGNARRLPAGLASTASLGSPVRGLQGANGSGTIGYSGPLPPPGHGAHHYHFKLYALDAPISLDSGASKKQLLKAMKGHVISEAELIGTYER